MTKQEFISELRDKLSRFPKQEVEERLDFYSEMIDDRIEDGLTEEAAISDLGTSDEIAAQIINDIPLSKIAKEKIKHKRRLGSLEIVLLVLGSPIWLSLAIAAVVVILALYTVLWALIISVWAVFASLAACAIGGLAAGVMFSATGNALTGLAIAAAGLFCLGLSILLFFGCRESSKGIIKISCKIPIGIKRCFAGKEKV